MPGRRAGGRPRRAPGRGHGATGRFQCAETPGLQPFLVMVRGGQGSHGGAEGLFLASGRRSDLRGRSFYGAGSPAGAGLPAAMSASLRIRSASPPGADLQGGAPVRLGLTQRRPPALPIRLTIFDPTPRPRQPARSLIPRGSPRRAGGEVPPGFPGFVRRGQRPPAPAHGQ